MDTQTGYTLSFVVPTVKFRVFLEKQETNNTYKTHQHFYDILCVICMHFVDSQKNPT